MGNVERAVAILGIILPIWGIAYGLGQDSKNTETILAEISGMKSSLNQIKNDVSDNNYNNGQLFVRVENMKEDIEKLEGVVYEPRNPRVP